MVDFKVLIVDDDFINRRLLIEILKKELYSVDTIESINGEDALNQLRIDPDIQLVLLDMEMPKLSGIEFLRYYINDDTISRIPIIAFSSNDEWKREALIVGADAFLTKPITEKKLMEAILYSSE